MNNADFQYDFSRLPEFMDRAMEKMRVAVVYGGSKDGGGAVLHRTYNSRAWKSYEKVADDIRTALKETGFRHVHFMPDDMNLFARLQREGIDMVWLNTGGVQGDNPTAHAPAMLEMAGVPFVGHCSLNMGRLDNKHVFKRELATLGIDTADFFVWDWMMRDMPGVFERRLKGTFGDYDGPFVVKPVSGRASVHVAFVESAGDLFDAVEETVKKTFNHVLIEKYLGGREFAVGVAGTVVYRNGGFLNNSGPWTFSKTERALERDEMIFTSMDKRPITKNRVKLVTEAQSPVLSKKLSDVAREIYTAFNLETIIRVDLRECEKGVLNVLEANPKPDLKRPVDDVVSLVTMGLDEFEMSYNDLILSLFADRLDKLLSCRPFLYSDIAALMK